MVRQMVRLDYYRVYVRHSQMVRQMVRLDPRSDFLMLLGALIKRILYEVLAQRHMGSLAWQETVPK